MSGTRRRYVGVLLLALVGGAAAVSLVGKKDFIKQSLPAGSKMARVTVKLSEENRATLKENWKVSTAESTMVFIVARDPDGKAVVLLMLICWRSQSAPVANDTPDSLP